jgi:hypothetical protein
VDTIEIDADGPVASTESTVRLSDLAATFLSTEHWSLLSARSLAWNETFNRVTVFLTTLSASAVALALVADASGFDNDFKIFSLVLFPIVLFLGIATYVRLVQINLEDIYLVAAMNRLRRAYIDDAPEIRPYLTSGASDDEAGLWETHLLGRPKTRARAQFLATTPTVVATLDAVIATVGAGALALHLGASSVVLVVLCIAVFIACWAGLFSLQIRAFETARTNVARFPSKSA